MTVKTFIEAYLSLHHDQHQAVLISASVTHETRGRFSEFLDNGIINKRTDGLGAVTDKKPNKTFFFSEGLSLIPLLITRLII